MKLGKILLTTVSMVTISINANAAEQKVPTEHRNDISVAIYNNDLSLIRDSRKVNFAKGINDIAFEDVSASIMPETASIDAKGISLIEQNFNFDLISPQKLLEKSVGKEITVIKTNPATGNETTETATVLGTNGGTVLKIGDRIETGSIGRYVFSGMPDKLRDKPTLVLKLDDKIGGEKNVELSYLTRSMSWKADYVAKIEEKTGLMVINGWVTLTNNSGVEYKDANVQLVAGDVNQVMDNIRPMLMKSMRFDAAAEMAGNAMVEEAFSDYHLYTLPYKTTIDDNQTKQVSLLSADGVKYNKVYELSSPLGIYAGGSQDKFEKQHAKVSLRFDNDADKGLGLPLPKGTVRVYEKDSSGKLLFIGEDRIDHTPKGEEVKLHTGDAFDVTSSGKRTSYNKLSDKLYEASYEVTIKNAKDNIALVEMRHELPGTWSILEENLTHVNDGSSTALWKLKIPANSEVKLTYSVRVKF